MLTKEQQAVKEKLKIVFADSFYKALSETSKTHSVYNLLHPELLYK